MSSPEPFNFGRKIKDLKRINKKGYADLQAGLKISRERIIALEENEREPSEQERLRFAQFYNITPEELGLYSGPAPIGIAQPQPPINPNQVMPTPTPRPSYNNNPNQANYNSNDLNPNYNAPGNYAGPREPRPSNYGNERSGNFGNSGNERSGNFGNSGNERSGNFNNNRVAPNPNQNPNYRPNPMRSGNAGGPTRPTSPPMNNMRPAPSEAPKQNVPPRQAKPAASPRPKEKEKTDNGEPKPVIKYTAEQLGDIESAYLRKQRDLKVPLSFTFLNGKEYTGVVVDFTPFTVHIIETGTGEEIILRKLAMAYYRKADAVEEARAQAEKSAQSKAEKTEEQPLLSSNSSSSRESE
jgi:hypothetical protein